MLIHAIAIQQAIMMKHRACMNIMKNNNAMLGMCRNFRGANPADLCAKETMLECSNLQNNLIYEMADAQEENAKEKLKEEKKRFNIFG